MKIEVTQDLFSLCPTFKGAALVAEVRNTEFASALWEEIDDASECIRKEFDMESLKLRPEIAATRAVYKLCGKDPTRYRPSGEALCRRIIQGKPLYRINTLVDLINLASIRYGYSIGGFDRDKICGVRLTLGIGAAGEPYEGIGRGNINIEGMPVYRDEKGGVGTPTSDNERTKLSLETTNLLVLINGYNGNEHTANACAHFIGKLLEKYAGAKSYEVSMF